jgi:hypothetical protein
MARQSRLRLRYCRFVLSLVSVCSMSLHGQDDRHHDAASGCSSGLAYGPCAAKCNADAGGSIGQAAATQPDNAAPGQNPRLTQEDAEKMAIKNNPRVSVAHLLALAQHQVVRETRAAELPTGVASITAEDAENASRISAGSLTTSRLFEHAGAGGGFTS